jgi:NTE family protein
MPATPLSALRTHRAPVIGLALGSGSARGWAHLGVLRALAQCGIRPGVVCGTSIGALVGGAHVLGSRDKLEHWALSLTRRDVVSFMDFSLGGGLLKGEKLMAFLRRHIEDRAIESLDTPFAAVATGLHSGEEVWLRQGSVADAVRASIALPGLFTPTWNDGRLLVDGGLVNPVPVSLARALGADIVIAVDLNADLLGRHLRPPAPPPPAAAPTLGWLQTIQQTMRWRSAPAADAAASSAQNSVPAPSVGALPPMLDTLATGIHIMQVRITRSRMSGDPPEFTIAPRLSHLALMDYHRAREAIDAGQQAAQECVALLRDMGLCQVPPPAADTGATPAAP